MNSFVRVSLYDCPVPRSSFALAPLYDSGVPVCLRSPSQVQGTGLTRTKKGNLVELDVLQYGQVRTYTRARMNTRGLTGP
jgi:hypothetical protein